MSLLVMPRMFDVRRNVLCQSRADNNKADTQQDSDELMDNSRCGNSEHGEQLKKSISYTGLNLSN